MNDPFIPEAARPCPNKVLAGEAWALASRLDGVNEQDASEGVLLILAGAEDRTAQRFGASAERLGIPCAIPRSAAEVGMRMLAERDGTVSCRLSIGEEQQPVRAVLNRGLPFSDQPFVEAELMASWWAALACFPGPVINRPSRDGFLPNPDVLRLASPESGIELPPIRIATSRELAIHAPATHLRRLSDGGHAGSFAAVPEAGFDDGEVYAATRFDPSRTCQVLVAGNEFFDLSHENGDIAPDLARRLRPVAARLRFSLLVVERDAAALRLTHASPFPAVHQYQHFEDRVHRALLEFLVL